MFIRQNWPNRPSDTMVRIFRMIITDLFEKSMPEFIFPNHSLSEPNENDAVPIAFLTDYGFTSGFNRFRSDFRRGIRIRP